VYDLCTRMTIKDVAEHMDMNWKTVKSIDKYYIKEQIESLRNINPKRIGVDEIAYRKGHNYLTVVRDLDLDAVIWVGFNRRKETLDEFFHLLGKEKRREISVVVTDMHKPYLASIRENCRQADVVIDKFHVIKMINEAIDEIRKREFAKADYDLRKKMKKMRFIILRRLRRLNDRQRENLYEMMALNDNLFQAYLLKEHISDIFDELSPADALERMKGWARNVNQSGLQPFIKVLGTIRRHIRGIYNYFKHQVTNAQSEGFNTKINIIRRKAYGFWDLEYFMLKIHQACGVMKLDGIQNGR
jgi:transposase